MVESQTNVSTKFIPINSESIHTGFPSAAENYIDTTIDLNEELIKNPISTFFLRVSGSSMAEAGIKDKDLIIIDRSLNPTSGCIVVAIIDREFTLKRLISKQGVFYLKSDIKDHPLINLKYKKNIQIWGVAIYSIHSLSNNKYK